MQKANNAIKTKEKKIQNKTKQKANNTIILKNNKIVYSICHLINESIPPYSFPMHTHFLCIRHSLSLGLNMRTLLSKFSSVVSLSVSLYIYIELNNKVISFYESQ